MRTRGDDAFAAVVVLLLAVIGFFTIEAVVTFANIAMFHVRRVDVELPVPFTLSVPYFARLRATPWEPIFMLFAVVTAGVIVHRRYALAAYRTFIIVTLCVGAVCAFVVFAAIQIWSPGIVPMPLF